MQWLEAKDGWKHIAWKYSTLLAAHRDRKGGRSHCEAIHMKVVNLLDWGHQSNTWPYSSTHWGGNWIDRTLQRCNLTDKRLVTLTLTKRCWLGMEVCFKQGPLSSYTCLRVSITRMLHCTTQHWQVDDEDVCLCTWKESGFCLKSMSIQNLRSLGHLFRKLATLNCNHIIRFPPPLALFTWCACDSYDWIVQ